MATETIDTVAPADAPNREIHEQLGRKYSAGFVTDIESDSLPPGLDEDTIPSSQTPSTPPTATVAPASCAIDTSVPSHSAAISLAALSVSTT